MLWLVLQSSWYDVYRSQQWQQQGNASSSPVPNMLKNKIPGYSDAEAIAQIENTVRVFVNQVAGHQAPP
jgi:hypothetical protein